MTRIRLLEMMAAVLLAGCAGPNEERPVGVPDEVPRSSTGGPDATAYVAVAGVT